MTTETRERGDADRRATARDKAREVMTVLDDAWQEHGSKMSYKTLAYYVTGRDITNHKGNRWANQTIKNVTEIDTIQLKSIDASRHKLQHAVSADRLAEWDQRFELEREEVRALGETIRGKLRW